ncbi:hypothetical protein PWT90_08450 [Aphanocladium album]|nr:hypothetical protein PWT90_08450 [Aphanocladium album]
MTSHMPYVTQEALDRLDLLNQERRRRENEEAEIQRRSKELTIRRCQVDLGITDAAICEGIANEVFKTEVEDRHQVAALSIYRREVARLRGGDGLPTSPPRILTSDKIEATEAEVNRAQKDLNRDRDIRNNRLRGYVNLCRTESTRVEGRACLTQLAKDLAEEFSRNPNYSPIGKVVHCGFNLTRIGRAEDYLTLHNPSYERGDASELAPNFRNIKIKGQHIAIRALKNMHADQYAALMENPQWSKPERGLVTTDPSVRRQPVIARIRELAGDAGYGRGYALAVQGHGDNGQFYGIASYNCIVRTSPNEFFETVHMNTDKCRMVDFNFDLACGALSMERAVEVATLLIEHARRYFGAQLFRTQCSPLNSRYIDIMGALGLGRFQTIEAASYNRTVTAMVWKFDTCAWKAAEVELTFRRRWFIDLDSMQEDPDPHKRPMKHDPAEAKPKLAIVKTQPTFLEDPAAFENTPQPMPPVVQLFPQAMQGVHAIEHTAWSASESQHNGSNSTGTTATGDSGTSSGLGNSESAQSKSTFGTFRTESLTDSSDSSPPPANGTFGLQDEHAASASTQSSSKAWDTCPVMQALRAEEASLQMPPPELPNRPIGESQQTAQSDTFSFAHYSDLTSESMEIDSQSFAPDDPKGKRPASTTFLNQSGPSLEQQQIHEACAQEAAGLMAEVCPAYYPDAETAPESSASYDRKGKRPASVSWETQSRKMSQPRSDSVSHDVAHNDSLVESGQVSHTQSPQSVNASARHEAAQPSRHGLSDCNQIAPKAAKSDYERTESAATQAFTRPGQGASGHMAPAALSVYHQAAPNPTSTLSPSPAAQTSIHMDACEPAPSSNSSMPPPTAPETCPLPTTSYDRPYHPPARSTAVGESDTASTHYQEQNVHQFEPVTTPTEAPSSVLIQHRSHRASGDSSRIQKQTYDLRQATDQNESLNNQRRSITKPSPPVARSSNTHPLSQQTVMCAPSSPPEPGHAYGSQQQPATMRQGRPSANPIAAFQKDIGYPDREQYKRAVYSYVEFVEEQLSKQHARPPEAHEVSKSDTADLPQSNLRQASQSGIRGPATNRQRGRRSTGRGASSSISTVSQPDVPKSSQRSLDNRQTDRRMNTNKMSGNRKANSEASSAHLTPSLGQPGPSNWRTSQASSDEYVGRNTPRHAYPTQISRATSAQSGSMATVPSDNADVPAPGPQTNPAARHNSTSAGVFLSTAYPAPGAQNPHVETGHGSSATLQPMPQQNSYAQHIPTQQIRHQHVPPQQAMPGHPSSQQAAYHQVPPAQIAHQQLPPQRGHPQTTPTEQIAPQHADQPGVYTTGHSFQRESQSQSDPKLRPWQL